MDTFSQEVTIIIVGSFFLLIVAIGIIVLLLVYQKKQLSYILEKEELKLQFQKENFNSQLEMQEQTFATISSEIHDNVGQVLSLAKVQMNIIGESETIDTEILAAAKENISKAMTDLRDIAKSLSSDRIQQQGLEETVRNEMERIGKTRIIKTQVVANGTAKPIEGQKKLILFRIVQESLQNIWRIQVVNAT